MEVTDYQKGIAGYELLGVFDKIKMLKPTGKAKYCGLQTLISGTGCRSLLYAVLGIRRFTLIILKKYIWGISDSITFIKCQLFKMRRFKLKGRFVMKKENTVRCSWATTALYKEYHDKEWGVPLHNDDKLFEMLILEGMQAGLSWLTVLNKREAFREAFDRFDCRKVALYDETKIEELMGNERIIRNRLKIKSAITNAQQFIKIQEEYGSFDAYIWSYVDYKPIHNHFNTEDEMPASTALSDRISKDLKKRGFKFVGSTIVYAYMQAVGIVNDHVKSCYLYQP